MSNEVNPDPSPEVLRGEVKWFDTAKGFGFVRPEMGDEDVFLHVNVLREFGQSSVAEQTIVTLEVETTARGCQAVRVIDLIPPRYAEGAVLPDLESLSAEAIEKMPYLPARTKWFDRAKGFGFATLFGDERDIFLHIDVLRSGGLEQPTPGEALALRVMKGKRGLIAVGVATWDHLPSIAAQ